MKKIVSLFLVMTCFAGLIYANPDKENTKESTEKGKIKTVVEKPSRDFIVLGFTYDNWARTPNDVNISGFGRGFSAYICYDFPISNSNFSFAAGLGINTNNYYFKDQNPIMNTSSDQIVFQDLDTNDLRFHKSAKLNTTYLEAPFELRYFANKHNRNAGFKASVGMHIGTLLSAHTKIRHSGPGIPQVITEKVSTKRYVESWRFSPIVRVGWGNFSVYGKYSISSLFKDGAGPTVFPYSVGITISGL